MKQIPISLLALFLVLLTACDKQSTITSEPSSLVVEGWIENGDFPVVIVTRSFPISEEFQRTDKLDDYLVRWAKVTISDGEHEVVLTGRYDDMYYPPYIYTTSHMRGEVGKHYYLTVEYYDYRATATTTIPTPPTIDDIQVKKVAENDTLFQITAYFKDNPKEKNYYQFFAKTGVDTNHYIASYLGSIDDATLDEKTTEYPIFRGHTLYDKEYTPYFCISEKVSVKCTCVDESAFRFWNEYTKAQTLNGNMFLSTAQNIPSNIIGGKGYWCGYGAVNKHFVMADYK